MNWAKMHLVKVLQLQLDHFHVNLNKMQNIVLIIRMNFVAIINQFAKVRFKASYRHTCTNAHAHNSSTQKSDADKVNHMQINQLFSFYKLILRFYSLSVISYVTLHLEATLKNAWIRYYIRSIFDSTIFPCVRMYK